MGKLVLKMVLTTSVSKTGISSKSLYFNDMRRSIDAKKKSVLGEMLGDAVRPALCM